MREGMDEADSGEGESDAPGVYATLDEFVTSQR